ncbi:hypothetical protein DFJ74DRAFT_683251 [Hyaloraphidium curvatum]|nr:hypothetical protein DFJ74DRAFT_683251 [Hyaloraphidium curvatum]
MQRLGIVCRAASACRPSPAAVRGLSATAAARAAAPPSKPAPRFVNPAFVPEPDRDNIETHTGPLDIRPPPRAVTKEANNTGYEGTWRKPILDVLKKDSPLGSYPRSDVEPHQFRSPLAYKYDKQDRREFGQYIQDEDEILNMFGPNVRQALWRQNIWIGVALAGVFSYWAFWYSAVNPEGRGNLGTSPPEYPFDGLIRELGGDPDNPDDAHLAAFYHGDKRPFRTVGFDGALRSEGKVWN